MNLYVHELGITGAFGNTSLRQLVNILDEDLLVEAIRVDLTKWLAPAGSLYLQVQDANGRKIKDSETIAISTISSANYFHGMVRFYLNVALKKETQYYIALKSSGYTYSGSAFIGWNNDYDLRRVTANYSTPSNVGANSPLGMEIWARENLRKGVYP